MPCLRFIPCSIGCSKAAFWALFYFCCMLMTSRELARLLQALCWWCENIEFQLNYSVLCQDMVSLEKCSQLWQLNISAQKCFALHLSFLIACPLILCGIDLPVREVMKDISVYMSSDLRWYNHCVGGSRKVDQVANCILCALQFNVTENYRKAFVVCCRPILECRTQIWSSSVKKDIEVIERVRTACFHQLRRPPHCYLRPPPSPRGISDSNAGLLQKHFISKDNSLL